MKRLFALTTLLILTWLFIIIIPGHHHQTNFHSDDNLICFHPNYHAELCQICLILANKLNQPNQLTFEYQLDLVASCEISSSLFFTDSYFNNHSNRAPPEMI